MYIYAGQYNKELLKKLITSGIIKTAFFAVFLMHMTVAHILLQSQVLCLEEDGSIAIEIVTGSGDCCDSPAPITADGFTEDSDETCRLCKDIDLSENCDEEYSLTKKQNLVSYQYILTYTIFAPQENSAQLLLNSQNENISSSQLESYKTVLLLI